MNFNFVEFDVAKSELAKAIPPRMHGGINRWVNDGIKPGGFLMAVLENDLRNAVFRADDQNIFLLREYLLLMADLPAGSYGSAAYVENWSNAGGLKGRVLSKEKDGEAK